MVEEKWEMPEWMEEYKELIANTGGNPIEELMNDNKTIVQVNAPRAMICVAVKSQIALLEILHNKGLLINSKKELKNVNKRTRRKNHKRSM